MDASLIVGVLRAGFLARFELRIFEPLVEDWFLERVDFASFNHWRSRA